MNELSSGDSYSHECNAISHELYEQLMASNAKYIRDFKEEKSLLHLKVAMGMPLKLKNCTIADLDVQDLEQGKTPLHYAVVLQNHEAALELIEHGASLLLADKLGNNAIYYAILNGSEQLVAAMFQNLSVERQQKLFNALNVNSYIKAACFSGKRNIYDFIVKIIAPELLANNAITNQIALGIFMPQLMKNLAATEQLEAVAAVTKMLPNIESTADKYVKSHILPLIGEGAKSLLPGRAYGVELELSNLPCIPGVPLNKLLSWFSANITQDGSVNMPIFSISNTCSQGEEIVSDVLDSTSKIKQFLLLTKYLHESGATTDKSTGLHVHINIRGSNAKSLPSITAGMRIDDLQTQDVELAVVKQIMTNWVAVEPMLQGFVRHGDLIGYKEDIGHYAAPIGAELDGLLNCSSLDEIATFIGDRDLALNPMSLMLNSSRQYEHEHHVYVSESKCHGTLEVRIHEGTVNPTLIEAWLNFIHRLVSISIEQIQQQITNQRVFEFVAYPSVKNLVHILLAERDYTKTWDSDLKAHVGSTASLNYKSWTVHKSIADAPTYTFYGAAMNNQTYPCSITDAPIQQRPFEQADIESWINLALEYPGISESRSAIANCTKNNVDSGTSRVQDFTVFSSLLCLTLLLISAFGNKLSSTVSNKQQPSKGNALLADFDRRRNAKKDTGNSGSNTRARIAKKFG